MAKPPLVVFCGIPGSGKSTIAEALGRRLGRAVVVRTDAVRLMVAKPDYGGVESGFVYSACVEVGRLAVQQGYAAILDGTFALEAHRRSALDAVGGLCGTALVVHVKCSIETARERNQARRSMVPWRRLLNISRRFQAPRRALVVDTDSEKPHSAVRRIMAQLALGPA